MPRRAWLWLALAAGACASSGKSGPALNVLPATASAQLQRSLDAARPHAAHVWRDMPPINPDGTVNAFVEIPLGERRKYEFDMAQNVRAVDRVMPESMGGYPVNYGFVPQTVSYDGDPFDVLVLGPPIEGGTMVRGLPVGVMFNEIVPAQARIAASRDEACGRMSRSTSIGADIEITPLNPVTRPLAIL